MTEQGSIGSDDLNTSRSLSNNVNYKELVIVNELVCYATFYRKNHARKSIEDIIIQYFSTDEILIAKDVIFKEFSANLEKPVNRRKEIDSKNIGDIMDGLDKLDAAGINVIATAKNLSRLPRCSPGDIIEVSILERLSLLEAKMSNVVKVVSDVKADNIMTTDKVTELVKKQVWPLPCNERQSATTSDVDPGDGAGRVPSEMENVTPPGNQTTMKAGPWGDAGRVRRLKEGDFQIPRAHAKKAARAATARRATIVTGTCTTGTVSGAPPPSRDFFISRIDKSTSIDTLRDDIESKGVAVRGLVKLNKDESKMDSYKLSVSVVNVQAIYKPEFWASGIQVRKFFNRNKNSNDNLNDNNRNTN